nr:phosphatidylinositide phosphatase SAC2 [Hymenolepis microstoma]
MEGLIEIFQTRDFYIFVKKPCTLYVSRVDGKITIKPFSKFSDLGDVVGLGSVEGILGKFQCSPNDDSYLLLLSRSDFICCLHDGIEVRRISKITLLPISSSSLPKTFQINKGPQNNTQVLSTQDRPQSAKQQALVQAVQNTFKAASDMINFKQKPKGINKRFENRILEELEKLFEGEADQFYYAKGGGDLTLWTQRREARRMRGEFCSWEDLKTISRTYWRPIWCRYDDCFVWNHLILQDLISPALEFLINSEGLPSSITEPKPPSPTYVDEFEEKEEGESTVDDNQSTIDGTGERAQLTDSLCALESMLIPVISGFVKQDKLALPIWGVDGRITSEEPDTVTLTIISRRSQYRAGCRYRRRGIDENGHVANYVETEQVLEVPGDSNTHVLSFLQIRGSVPVFWTQTGIKYKPPIQLHRSLSENRDAFRLHIERPLSKFDHLTVVNLLETTPGRQESKITEAYIRQLLLLNNPRVTYVGFDFHEYCKGLRFDNVAVLLDGVKESIRDMKYCWFHKDYFMCKQEGVFRVNCVDCLDRTNLVQSVFATVILESQLQKLGRLPPEVELPVTLARAVQAVWADNGDALSRHYTGTAAMKVSIQYHRPTCSRGLSENRDAFRLHIERPLSKFDHLTVVNLLETTPGRQESKITEAYIRQLLLLNNPRVTYVGFDFHEYCKGLRFDNVAVLLDGVKESIRDMKYCWFHKDYFMCKQEGVFRVNCVDCLDRTNLVQSVFATVILESQLQKLGRLPPEVELPVTLARAVQAVWADNGDALSRHYTGTAAMKVSIQYHRPTCSRGLSENRDAFRLHIERPLSKFDHLTVVNLLETTPGRQESKITEAYIRQLLLLNNPRVTYVGFDFHEYCKGLRFDNVAVLLDGVKESIRDMKYCWFHKDYFMCKQEGVFRVNCVDCLDRTNLVQSVFATVILESQLQKLGRLPPEVELPVTLARAVQAVWADNGDALSRHYTGTAAMKGDYTRTGSRTVNGLMKDGVSSMSRYYQRFGEIKRQAAMDFLLGHANSPELRFLRNCSSPNITTQKLSNIEASSLLAAIRSTCLENDEDSFFEFVASTSVMQSRRTEVRAFGILTSRYLHIVRFVDDPLVNSQAHLRIPIQSINHVSLATENALFRQPTPVLHVYFKAPKDASSRHSAFTRPPTRSNPGEWRSSDDASSESVLSIQSPSTVKRSSPFNTARDYDQYRLDLRQAPFRLFNNYLVPITSADEATDSLRAISEFITVLYQSIDPTVNLELTTTPDIRQNGRSVMQRRTTLLLPPEYTKPLDKEVRSALSERRDSLRPFLMSFQLNRRNRRSQGNRGGNEQRRSLESSSGSRLWAFGNPAASHTPSDLTPKSNLKGIRNSLDRLVKQSSALAEIVRPNTTGSAKQIGDPGVRTNDSLNAQRNEDHKRLTTTKIKIIQPVSEVDGRRRRGAEEIPVKVLALAEPFEDIEDENDDETSTSSDIECDGLEQGIDALMVSDIEDVPGDISKPARHTSFSDLLHELRDAAAVPVEDDDYVEQEEDDTYEDCHPESDTDQTHARPISSLRKVSDDVTAKPSNAIYVNDPDVTISSKRPTSHLTQHNVTQSSPSQSILSQNDSSGISRMSQRRSRPISACDDILLHPRSYSWDGPQINDHKKIPLKRNVSDTLIVCYREIFHPKGDQRDPNRVERLSLKQQLNMHFENFSIPSINRLLESATPPKIVIRLLQRQKENAAAINHEPLTHKSQQLPLGVYIGYLLVLFCMFIPQIISPSFAFPVGGLILFYGVYFGLIARDFAEVCTDKMAAHISYFSETGIPLRKIDPSVCALCTKVMLNGQAERRYKLNCTHVFHEFCLRGWCIVGKKDICPYCKEKVNLHRLIKNPWEKPHLLFGNLLDGIRYLVAWQPLIVMAVHTIIWALDLK